MSLSESRANARRPAIGNMDGHGGPFWSVRATHSARGGTSQSWAANLSRRQPHENSASPGRRRSPTELRSWGRKLGCGSPRDGHRYGQRRSTAGQRGERPDQTLGMWSAECCDTRHGGDARALRGARARRMLWRCVLSIGRRRRIHARHRGHRRRLRQRRAPETHSRRGAHHPLGHHGQVTAEQDEEHPSGTAESRQHTLHYSIGRANSSMRGGTRGCNPLP